MSLAEFDASMKEVFKGFVEPLNPCPYHKVGIFWDDFGKCPILSDFILPSAYCVPAYPVLFGRFPNARS